MQRRVGGSRSAALKENHSRPLNYSGSNFRVVWGKPGVSPVGCLASQPHTYTHTYNIDIWKRRIGVEENTTTSRNGSPPEFPVRFATADQRVSPLLSEKSREELKDAWS